MSAPVPGRRRRRAAVAAVLVAAALPVGCAVFGPSFAPTDPGPGLAAHGTGELTVAAPAGPVRAVVTAPPEDGHFILWQRPETVREPILELLERAPRGPGADPG